MLGAFDSRFSNAPPSHMGLSLLPRFSSAAAAGWTNEMPLLQSIRCSASPFQLPTTQTLHPAHLMAKPLALSSVAHQLLDGIPLTDTFAWNALIRAHLADADARQAILIYREMLLRGARADKHTLPHLLTATRLSGAVFYGEQVHAHVFKLGFASDAYVVTSLMEFYAQFEGADVASMLLDHSSIRNSLSWTLLAKLYLMEAKPKLALQVFHRMVESDIKIDAIALVSALKACGQLKSFKEGKKVHEIARKKGLECDVLVGNALLKMYLDCGRIKEVRAIFDRMPVRDALSWTTIISGYVHNGGFNEGLKFFRMMGSEGVRIDSFSVSAVLPACARMAAHKHGKEIHGYILRHGIEMNVAVQNALMDMYAKSGSIEAASKIFERMAQKDAISWTVMILGHSLHGQGELGVKLFHEMEEKTSMQIDRMSYIAGLHACNTACMVDEGKLFFSHISEPQVEHCALMVSLLSRAGNFVEARALIEEYQIGQHADMLRALLNGCRIHQNVKMGKRLAEQLIELEPLNAENYVLLSNVYATSGKWNKVEELRETIQDMGLKPKRAYSWIEVRSKVHVFSVGDVSHPRSEGIYWKLEDLMKKIEEEGFEPKGNFSLHDVDEERQCIPCGHSEMLAIAFGLISSLESTIVRVTKNLRVCQNCHAMGKMISKVVKREIVLKDPEHFHHFKNGFCSCSNPV